MTTRKKSRAVARLESLAGGPLTLARLLVAIREGEGWSQTEFAEKLGVSRSHVCDIEKGRKTVSPSRAAKFAKTLGYSEPQFVQLALQSLVEEAGLRMDVQVEAR